MYVLYKKIVDNAKKNSLKNLLLSFFCLNRKIETFNS